MSAECGRRRRAPTSPRSSSRRRSAATTSRAARRGASTRCSRKTRTFDAAATASARARRARPRARPLPAERADRDRDRARARRAQPLHPDDAIYPLARPHDEIVVNAMWPLCDFTADNGGTVLVPGSHRWANEIPGPDTPTITIEMPAGSLLLYRGSLWHGGGANHTDQPRLGVVVHYAASWLRPVENHVLVVPPEIGARPPRAPAGAPRLQHPPAVHRLRRRSPPAQAARRD